MKLKYLETLVTFSEVPNEISICINISNCPCGCKDCHSSYLAEDKGEILSEEALDTLIKKNKGITCVAFMGGDINPIEVYHLCKHVRKMYPSLKIAWYSGRNTIDNIVLENLDCYDYIKVGPYKEEYGPLNNPNTNQRFYKVIPDGLYKYPEDGLYYNLEDITYKFWKGEEDENKNKKD